MVVWFGWVFFKLLHFCREQVTELLISVLLLLITGMSKKTRSQAQFGLILAETRSKNNQIPIIAKGMCY